MNIKYYYSHKYSKPLKGPSDGGPCRQVVLIQRCISITDVVHGAAHSGHYREVRLPVILPQTILSCHLANFILLISISNSPLSALSIHSTPAVHTSTVHTVHIRPVHTVHTVCIRPVARLNDGGVLLDQSGPLRYVNGHCG